MGFVPEIDGSGVVKEYLKVFPTYASGDSPLPILLCFVVSVLLKFPKVSIRIIIVIYTHLGLTIPYR